MGTYGDLFYLFCFEITLPKCLHKLTAKLTVVWSLKLYIVSLGSLFHNLTINDKMI